MKESACCISLISCVSLCNCCCFIDLNISFSSTLPPSACSCFFPSALPSCIASSFPFNFGMLAICWKVSVSFVWPTPNCPWLLRPQLHTPPSQSTICKYSPAVLQEESEDIGGMSLTFCGVCLSFLSPNPSCPYPLFPQVKTFPCLSRNIEKLAFPPATATIPERLLFF